MNADGMCALALEHIRCRFALGKESSGIEVVYVFALTILSR